MIGSHKFARKIEILDPDEPMVGTCTVCKSVVNTVRSKTSKDDNRAALLSQGLWSEIPYVECPTCREESARIIANAGTRRQPVGTKVYVYSRIVNKLRSAVLRDSQA